MRVIQEIINSSVSAGLVQPWVYLLAPLKLRSNTPLFVLHSFYLHDNRSEDAVVAKTTDKIAARDGPIRSDENE